MLSAPNAPTAGGLACCGDASCNLANPPHLDVGDAARSFAVWVRQDPRAGTLEGHWFLFPDVGLAIELDDSLAISWDGRECVHCTSAPRTPLASSDALLSLFVSMPGNVLAAGRRVDEMREALAARAHSDPGAFGVLGVGDRVWGKWYPRGCVAGSRDWRRATGVVRAVDESASTLTVSWRGESGRGKSTLTLATSQAHQMLVRAGALAPRCSELHAVHRAERLEELHLVPQPSGSGATSLQVHKHTRRRVKRDRSRHAERRTERAAQHAKRIASWQMRHFNSVIGTVGCG